MFIRRWISTLLSYLFGRSARAAKPTPKRTGYRPRLEGLEDRLPPAAGLASSNQQLLSAYGQLPLSFEANQGQTAARVQYFTHTNGGTLFLTSTSAVLSLTKPVGQTFLSANPAIDQIRQTGMSAPQASTTGVALALNLVGANPNASVLGLDQLPGTSNYFIGNDPSQWHTNIPNFSKVEYQNVYPGINLVYYGDQQQLEYDYQLAPDADPSRIRFAVQGADSLSIDAKGNLVLHTAIGDVLEHAPVIYQQLAGTQQPVSGQFVLLGNNEVGFQVGAYDAKLPLVIDPVLSYSTYLGGDYGGNGYGYDIAVDDSGNAYVIGLPNSSDFPTTMGAFQTSYPGGENPAFVTKLNASGTALIYSTWLGGAFYQQATAIAVDASGNAYLTGSFYSPGSGPAGFPVTSGAFQTSEHGPGDAFVTKLNATGTALVYSTYLGGSLGEGASSIAVDGSGSAYVTGGTNSTDFPTTAGAVQTNLEGGNGDAFVTKLNASGSALVYSTYLGGTGDDHATGIAVDASGSAHVTGDTFSTNFPTTAGAFQTTSAGGGAFVTALNASGTTLVYSTYLGGNDASNSISLDGSGNAYVTGSAGSTNFPTTTGAFQTSSASGGSFVSKLNASGTGLVYSTYLGDHSVGKGIAVDGAGNAYVTGYTSSAAFPTTSDAYQTSIGFAIDDAFVTKLNSTGTDLVYSTYLGGNFWFDGFGNEGTAGNEGWAIAVDGSGNPYVTGYTTSTEFPTTPGAFQTSFASAFGSSVAFVAKFAFAPTTTTLTSSLNPSLAGQNVSFTATVTGGGGNSTGTVSFTDGSTTLGVADLSTPEPTGWGDEADMPTARSILATATGADGRIYALSGEVSGPGTDGGGRTNVVEAYDTTTNSWATVANIPTARDHLAAATGPDGRIYAIGGVSLSGSNVVEAYDPTTNTWATVASMPTGRWSLAAVTGPDGRIYAIGGTTDGGVQTNTVEAYDVYTNTWSTVSSMPTARTYLAAAVGPDGRIYAIGGYSETGGYGFSTVEAYDVYTNTWSTVASLPAPRYGVAAATGPDGLIYEIGGPDTVEAYDTNTNTWVSFANLPQPTGGPAAATGPDGRIYAIGGWDGTENLNTVEALSFTSPTATFSTSSLSIGSHAITAVYSGDANFSTSTSPILNQIVQGQPTTTTLTDNGPNPSYYGDAVSFTATVSDGSETDGETVFIEDADAANAVVASPTLSGGSVTFTISSLTVGTHDLFAIYNGDDNNAGSNSSTTPVTQVVNAITPAVASVVVNGGAPQYVNQLGVSPSLAGQNSVVEQILVTFNEPVTLAPGAFSILANIPVTVNSGPMPNTAEVDLNAPIQVGDGHQWIVTFANSAGTRPNGYGAYLIDDGVYTLHIDHTKVTAVSQTMAADSDTGFWALYGDTTYHQISGVDLNVGTGYVGDGYSDASVGNADFAGFKSCYNADASNYYAPPNYNVKFDYNLDGSDAASDFTQFKINYNTDWQF
jgi:Bacterial Ig-like domain (group 3)/Kelch motif/Beta-propeller repeat